MRTGAEERRLRLALLAVGAIFTFGAYPMILGWQSGWRWEPNRATTG